jgi:uncharacterized damage-inducible protein DinB
MRLVEHYEILVNSRRKVLAWARALTPEQLERRFAFGHESVLATLAHLAGAEWLYGKAVRGEEIDRNRVPFAPETRPDLESIERGWKELVSTWVVHDLDHLAQIVRVMARQHREAVGPWAVYLRVLRP